MGKKTFVVIDGNSVMHRAFHALPPLTNRRGEAIGAVYGFCLALFNVAENFGPDYMAVCFDTHAATFRHTEFKEYKAQRPETAAELIPQFELIQKLLGRMGVAVFTKDGYEADDLIATVINKCRQDNGGGEADYYVLTGDYDSLQLVDGKVKVNIVTRGVKNAVLYDRGKVVELFGVLPEQIPAYKALAGDSSDNIPGAPGIGKKGGAEILRNYKTLDEAYRAIEKGDFRGSQNIKNILTDNKEKILCFKRLATMVSEAPIDATLAICKFDNFKGEEPRAALLDLGLASLAKRLENRVTSKTGTLF